MFIFSLRVSSGESVVSCCYSPCLSLPSPSLCQHLPVKLAPAVVLLRWVMRKSGVLKRFVCVNWTPWDGDCVKQHLLWISSPKNVLHKIGLHDILHAICMRITSVKPVPWLAVNLHHLFSNGAAFNTQSRRSLTSYAYIAFNIACDTSAILSANCVACQWSTALCIKGAVCSF